LERVALPDTLGSWFDKQYVPIEYEKVSSQLKLLADFLESRRIPSA